MPSFIHELPQVTSVAGSDLLVVETNPNSTPNTKIITVTNFLANISSNNIAVGNLQITSLNTPTNSTITVTRGSIFFDTNYAYFAVANNVLKRVSLATF